jgi:hypothetical protein
VADRRVGSWHLDQWWRTRGGRAAGV